MSELLSLDTLLGARNRRYVERETKLGRARFRIPTEEELASYEQGAFDGKGEFIPAKGRQQRRRLIAMMLVDADGNPIFTSPADIDAAKEVVGPVMRELFWICRDLAGLNDTLEDLVKNSDEITGDDSVST